MVLKIYSINIDGNGKDMAFPLSALVNQSFIVIKGWINGKKCCANSDKLICFVWNKASIKSFYVILLNMSCVNCIFQTNLSWSLRKKDSYVKSKKGKCL